MSYPPEPPWSVSEKDVLLVTLLRALTPDLTTILMRLIEERPPNNDTWSLIPLPKGHSLRSCQYIFDEMRRATFVAQPYMQLQPIFPHPPAGPGGHRKRSWDQEPPPPAQRELLPRPPRSTDSPNPPVTNGEGFMINHPLHRDKSSEPPKKRGRPSKEAVEQREKEYAAKGEVYKPKHRKTKKPENLAGSPLPPTASTEASIAGTPVVATPQRANFEVIEESSSGKRRSKRQREESVSSEQPRVSSIQIPRETQSGAPVFAAQSPSDRLLARSGDRDTTAAAVARDIHEAETTETSPSANE